MIYDIISYTLIGVLFTATIIPLIALLRKTIQEQRELDEANTKSPKKTKPHELKAETFLLSRAKSS